MNNSLQRFCAGRARLLHRSKNLALTSLPQKHNPAQLFDKDGKWAPKWLVVDWREVNGRNNGDTFNAGINRFKRSGAPHGAVRELKQFAWDSARGR